MGFRTQFHILFLRFLLILVKTAKFLQRPTRSLVLLFKKITKPIGNLLINWLIIRPYTLLFKLKAPLNHFRSHFTPYQLGRPETIIYIALFLSLLVTTNSFKIKALASEDFGLHNLISPLIVPEEEFFSTEGDLSGQLTLPNDVAYTLTPDGAAILKPTLVSTLPGIAGRKSLEYYNVRSGDTISSVASRFNLKMTTLLWENRLTERSTLRIGQTLTILPSDGVSYRIGRGDTLAQIASRYKVKQDAIANFNQLGNKLSIGQIIIIPGGRPPAQAPVAVRPPTKPAQGNQPITQPVITPSNTKLAWPTLRRRLTQYFTWRHSGLDIADSIGTPIVASEDGIVEVAGWNRGGYGYYIIIDHGGGLKTLYGHASQLLVTVGDRVTRGQLIAAMGSTGRSTGSHVHYEVRLNGRKVNPLKYTK